MAGDFYPFVGEDSSSTPTVDVVSYAARIAVYDDPAATPRVVVVEPTTIRDYLAQITERVTQLSHEQGGSIPFMVIREIVENYIHASFISPIISILDRGNTLRFADQGPGIAEKKRALEYGTTSATEEMKHYIRGVGSGLPLAQHYMVDKGGSLTIEDNISTGTIVTISVYPAERASVPFTSPTEVPSTQPPDLPLTDRARLVLDYLSSHTEVGPTDLLRSYGGSQPTWSRELKNLENQGILVKRGQKRRITEVGRSFFK